MGASSTTSPNKSDRLMHMQSEKENGEKLLMDDHLKNGGIKESKLVINHPRNSAYYFGPPPPMIVTGPSNDIRNMQYSDSYNDSYGNVIYEESQRKNGQLDDEEITSSEMERSESYNDESTKDVTPELMQYDDEEDEN